MATVVRFNKSCGNILFNLRKLISQNTPRVHHLKLHGTQHKKIISQVYGRKSDRDIVHNINRNVQEKGFISSLQIHELHELVLSENGVSKDRCLMLLRCTGNLMSEEHPRVRQEALEEVWKDLEARDLVNDVVVYNSRLSVYLQNEHQFSPTEYLSEMENHNIKPNRLTYEMLLAQYCSQGDIDGATNILKLMNEAELPIGENIFNSFIKGNMKINDMDGVQAILDTMKQREIQPSPVTYEVLLKGYAELGNIKGFRETLDKANEEEVYVKPSSLMSSLINLAENGHQEHIEEIVALLEGIGEEDAQEYIQELISRGYYDSAYKLYRCTKPSQEKRWNFFIKNMVKHQAPLATLLDYMEELRTAGYHEEDITNVTEYSLLYGTSTDYAFECLDRMYRMGYEMRTHYFKPLIKYFDRFQDKSGLMSLLQKINKATMPGITSRVNLAMSALPTFDKLGGEDEENLEKSGFDGYVVHNIALKRLFADSKFQEAADYLKKNKFSLVTHVFKPKDVNLKEADCEFILEILEEIQKGNSTTCYNEEVNGHFVYLVTSASTISNEALHRFLTTIVEKNLVMHSSFMGLIRKRLHSRNMMHETLFENFKNPGKFKRNDIMPSIKTLVKESSESLERMLDLEPNNLKIMAALMENYYYKGEMEKADLLKDRLESHNFQFPPVTLAMFGKQAVDRNDLAEALNYSAKIKSLYSHYASHVRLVLEITRLQLANGSYEDACNTLRENKAQDLSKRGPGLWKVSKDISIQLVKACGSLSHEQVQNLIGLLYDGQYCYRANDSILGEYIRLGMTGETPDTEYLVTAIEHVATRYQKVPLLRGCVSILIDKEEKDKLRKVFDMARPILSDDIIFGIFLDGYTFNRKFKQVQKLIEKSKLSSERIQQQILRVCDRLFRRELLKYDKGEIVESFVKTLLGTAGIDKENMLFHLTRFYAMNRDTEKLGTVLERFEEEMILPSPGYLQFLAKMYRTVDLEIDFDLPSPESLSDVSAVHYIKCGDFDGLYKLQESSDSSQRFLGDVILDEKMNVQDKEALLHDLGNRGNVEEILAINDRTIPKQEKLRHLMNAYINSGRAQEYISLLEKTPEDMQYISMINIKLMYNKNPELVPELGELLLKCKDKAVIPVVVFFWTHYIIHDQMDKADAIVNRFPAMLNSLNENISTHNVFMVCEHAVVHNKEEFLTWLLQAMKPQNNHYNYRPLALVYGSLIRLYCLHNNWEKALDVYHQSHRNRIYTNKFRARDMQKFCDVLNENNQPIPSELSSQWKKSEVSEETSSSSSSSDEEDDEAVKD